MLSVIILIVSRRSLIHIKSHGFYRFFAWEFILILFLQNVDYWFVAPFSFHQIISWILLFGSALFVVEGYRLLRTKGNINELRPEKHFYKIEKTKNLVTEGVYHYIRHPLYTSLLFLAWGIFFKSVSIVVFFLVIGTSFFLTLTAKAEEKENCDYFGDDYSSYMKRTKMFIPYVW
jgi:protein-S-isoprenylcysteine O-methyltransferase Ste14